jgi:predicted kinase
MEETYETYPKWNTEQKLSVREAQVALQTIRDQAAQAIRNAEKSVIDAINAVTELHKLDPKTVELNLATLEYVTKK